MSTSQAIYVALSRDAVRGAVTDLVSRAFPDCAVYAGMEKTSAGDIVISAPGDFSLDRCRELAERERILLILAPLPDAQQAAAYQLAGARAYVPMVIDAEPLLAAIAANLRRAGVGDGPKVTRRTVGT